MGPDYTLHDWLQVLLLLIGMPLVAATGAALGLIGRVRKGGFLQSTIAGLAGAAIASAVLYLGIWTLLLESTISPTVFLEIYESGYQRHISFACLIATFVIALLWAIRWRLVTELRPPTNIAITLRTALLMQVLSLLCVGSWCGLRAIVYSSANPQLMTKRIWESRGWQYGGNELTLSASGMTPADVAQALAPEKLRDLSRFTEIRGINISTCDLTDMNLSALNSAKQVAYIGFTDCEINAFFAKEISQIQHLTGITLRELTTVQPTLTQLAKLPKLEIFTAENARFEREDFRRLFADSAISRIYLHRVELYQPGKPIDQWPPQTRSIYLTSCNLAPADLLAIGNLKSLTQLHLGDSPVDDAVLEHFQELSLLQNVSLTNKNITLRGYEIVTQKMQPPMLHIAHGELPQGVATLLGKMSKLQVLNLSSVIVSDEEIDEIGKSASLTELHLTSPGLSKESLQALAKIPTLRQLHYPSYKGCREFEDQFAAERQRRNLPSVQLTAGVTIDAASTVSWILP